MSVPQKPHVVVLGCGFTGKRVAARLLERGCRVTAMTRSRSNLLDLAARGVEVLEGYTGNLEAAISPGCLVLHSLPSIEGHLDATILGPVGKLVSRVVYLSTTGVYGAALEVDEHTPVSPGNARESARADTENAILSGPWQTLILRPAAIYGPGRGVHVAIRNGTFRLVPGSARYVSRIHVEDLATHVEAGLFSGITGAYPVADEHPCPSEEIATFCAGLLGVGLPALAADSEIPETRRANRKVDGGAIRRLLGVRLQYPSYRQGIPASLVG